ncbi:MAG: WD40/YVTN/BNR-like repeat-containing protein, partial [bacterium]
SGGYLSRDDGQTWSHALPDMALFFNGESIVAEPNHPDTIYVGALYNRQNPRDIFFRSFDRGRTWSRILIPAITQGAGFCTVVAAGGGILLGGAGTQGRIFRSTDYGSNWTQVYQVSNPQSEIPKISTAKRNDRTIYAAVQSLSPSTQRRRSLSRLTGRCR